MAIVGRGTGIRADCVESAGISSVVGQKALLSGKPNTPGLLPSVAHLLRTGCLYEPQPERTCGVLVTRAEPRRKERGMPVPIVAWWPHLAPSLALVRIHHPVGTSWGWEQFVACYWAELQATSRTTYLRAVVQLGFWLRRYPTVTLLSFEQAPWGEESLAQTQRRILYAWLLGYVAPTDLAVSCVV